jgi:AraC-like DNA-binding protein
VPDSAHSRPLSSAEPLQTQRIPFVTVTNWVRAARLCGIDIEAIFNREGLDTLQIHPETSTVHRATLQRVMFHCIDEARRIASTQHFPLVLGETFAFEYLSDVETFIATSATLRDATRVLEWIPQLVNPYMRFQLSEQGHEARLSLRFEVADSDPSLAWPFTEAIFTTIVKFCKMLLGGQPLIGRITLRHQHHADADKVAAHFQVPITWGAEIDALWFERSLLDQALRGAFRSLHELAGQRVANQVAQRVSPCPAKSSAQAGHLLPQQIEQAFAGKPRLLGLGLDALADELGLHPRTLQRRLKAAGESHSNIQSRVRHRLAQTWLQQPELSIEDISERLGFTDRRSFTLAFTRWSGQTPSEFRRNLR